MSELEQECLVRAHEAKLRTIHMVESAAAEHTRPFMLIKPRVFPDGNQWCALYGDNIQEGVCGFGDTPHQASVDFDIQWLNAAPGRTRQSYECHDGIQCEAEHPCLEKCQRLRNSVSAQHD